MDCNDAILLISGRIDGEQDAGQQTELMAHLAECPACAVLCEALQLQDVELRRVFEPRRRRADAVADRVLSLLQAAYPSPPTPLPQGERGQRVSRISAPRMVLALTTTAALIGIVVWLNKPDHRPVSRAEPVVKADPSIDPPAVEAIPVPPRSARPGADSLAVGAEVKTKTGERRRVVLPDASVLFVNQNTSLTLPADRHIKLAAGEVYVEAAALSAAPDFVVETPLRSASGMGTRFAVQANDVGTGVFVAQGKVQVSGLHQPLVVGQQLTPGAEQITEAPRASFLLDWTRDLFGSESPLVPKSDHSGGSLVVVDAAGKDTRLSLRKSHIDVHIEDGFARTTIDQTYFNHNPARMEGTFYFPLPADASLSRLAMYVANGNECSLSEGGMVERDYGRTVFESIVTRMKDPALLEWVDGSTFKMRVFPLEGRQEKRIILSYTQKLDSLYGNLNYRFPSGHSLQAVGAWSFHARIKGGARSAWSSPSHELTPSCDDGDLLLDAHARNANLDRDVWVKFADGSTAGSEARFSSAEHEGARYLMLRYRPTLPPSPPGGEGRGERAKASTAPAPSPPTPLPLGERGGRGRKDWVFLFESSGDRDPILARTQIEIIKTLLANAGRDDTFAVLTAGTRVQSFAQKARPVTRENIDAAVAFLEKTRRIGALDLEQALTAARAELAKLKSPYLVHVGSGIAVLGERKEDVLAKSLPENVPYVGVGVGKRWSRSFMKQAADRSGGAFVQINPDEPVAWRAFELSSLLDVPRLLNIQIVDNAERVKFLGYTTSLAQGEELCAIARMDGDDATPQAVTVAGTLNGKPFEKVIHVEKVAPNAGYLPRTWAKLEIDRLLAEDRVQHKDRIVALSKSMYVMTPFTSLLVLENEAMYAQYNVDRGRKDHWAMYPCPAKIPTVYEPEPVLARTKRIEEEYRQDLVAMREARTKAETAMAATRAEVERQLQGIDKNYREVVRTFAENIIDAEKFAADLARMEKQKQELQFKLEAALKDRELKIKKLDLPTSGQVLETVAVRVPSDTAGQHSPATKTASNVRKPNPATAMKLPAAPQVPLVNIGSLQTTQLSPYLNLIASGKNPPANYYLNVNPMGMPGYNFASTGYGQLNNGLGVLGGGLGAFGVGMPVQGGGFAQPNPVNFWQYSNTTGVAPTVGTVPMYNQFGQTAPAGQAIFAPTRPTVTAEPLEQLGVVVISATNQADVEAVKAMIDRTSPVDRTRQLLAHLAETDRKLAGQQGDRAVQAGREAVNLPADDIYGKVVDVDDATGRVRINVGSDSGIIKNNMLEVYRLKPRPAYVGAIKIYDVRPNEAIGKLMGAGPRGRIQKDDEVASRIIAGPDQPSHGASSVSRGMIASFTSGSSRHSLLYKPPSFHFGERYFLDLLAHAPAMNTSAADIQAVLESEAAPDLAAVPGVVDPAAARLIEQGRTANWQRVTVADSGFTLLCNGAGQFRYERVLPDGLREIGVCDGKTLLHLYPELGIGARRVSSRFHWADFIDLVPWNLPPLEDLARGRDVKLLDANTVRLVPHPLTLPSPTRGEGTVKPWTEIHLVFSEGWLRERRWIEMPSNKRLAQEIYGADGSVKRPGPDGKLIAEHKLDRQPAEAPELSPDTKSFVVMPFPLRNWATANRCFNPESKSYAQLDETAALALMGAAIAGLDHTTADSIYSERFHRKGDRRIGFLTLLSPFGPDVASPRWKKIIADYSSEPLGKYLGRLTDRQQPADVLIGDIGGPRDGFVPGLAELHDHYVLWNSDKALKGTQAEKATRRDRALDYVRRNSPSAHGWAVLVLLREKLAGDPRSRKALTESLRPFEKVPALSYAARYEIARDLLNDGQRAAAREQFKSLYEAARQEMTLPAIDTAFRLAMKSDDAYPLDLFRDLLRETAQRLISQDHRGAVIDLAWQCRQLDDSKLADELCELALSNMPEDRLLPTILAAFPYLWQTGQQDRADRLLQQLLTDARFNKEPSLWRLASQVAAHRKSLKRSMEYLDTALAMEYRQLPDVIHLDQVRSDYSQLLSGYQQLAAAMNVLESPARAEFITTVARAADRWRSLDSDGTAACHAAVRILQLLDDPDLAWDYWTTPLGQQSNEPAPWARLARSLQDEGALELADRAYGQAFKSEPTNAQLLWDRAQNLQQMGTMDRSSSMLRQLADGQWQPQFREIQAEARRQLANR